MKYMRFLRIYLMVSVSTGEKLTTVVLATLIKTVQGLECSARLNTQDRIYYLEMSSKLTKESTSHIGGQYSLQQTC